MEFRTRMERMVRMEFRTRMERIVRNVFDERNERNERYKRDERDERIERIERKKRKTGNGNRRWRDSSLLRAVSSLLLVAPKIQQFWVIFRRFDINIFNLSEHFPPPNFAYSARSFPLPSPNLN